jgi:hypothetical protein
LQEQIIRGGDVEFEVRKGKFFAGSHSPGVPSAGVSETRTRRYSLERYRWSSLEEIMRKKYFVFSEEKDDDKNLLSYIS